MATYNRRSIALLKKRLADLIAGMAKFELNTDLQSALSKKGIEEMEQSLSTIAEEYRAAEANARVLYKRLESKVDETLELLSSSERIIRAKFGVKDKNLLFFGLKPYKENRKSSESSPDSTSTVDNTQSQ